MDAFVLAAQAAPVPSGRIYNLAGPCTTPLRETVVAFGGIAAIDAETSRPPRPGAA